MEFCIIFVLFFLLETLSNFTKGVCSPTASPDRNSHSGLELTAWFLQKAAQYEVQTGKRIIHYLDLHYYAQGGYVILRDFFSPNSASFFFCQFLKFFVEVHLITFDLFGTLLILIHLGSTVWFEWFQEWEIGLRIIIPEQKFPLESTTLTPPSVIILFLEIVVN